jgi:hypothetical protein
LNGCFTATWKANGKTTTLVLFLDSLFPKTEMLPLETKQLRGKLLPHSDLQGGVFLWEVPNSRCYSKKDYKRKKKEQHSYKIGTWNVRTLNRRGKLENLKKEMQKNEVSVLGVRNKEVVIIQCIVPEVNRLKKVWQ